MRSDLKSNFTFAVAEAPTTKSGTTEYTAAVDHTLGSSAMFIFNVSSVGTGGTLTVKLQYSDDNTNWTDYSASALDAYGNTGTATAISAAGCAAYYVVSPLGRYSRAAATAATDTIAYSATSILGPERHA